MRASGFPQLGGYMKKWIVCSGPEWYSPSVTSTKQLMRLFKTNGYCLLWINPIAFKSPFVNSINRKSALEKIKYKFLTHLRWLRRNSKRQWVLVPVYLPLFKKWADSLNRWLVRIQVRVVCLALGIRVKKTILWISGSFTAEAFLDWPFQRKVYQAADLISGFRNAAPALKAKLQARESNLCHRVDVIFSASERISQGLANLSGTAEKIHLLHHGVDLEHFSKSLPPPEKMVRIRAMEKPVAGYFGSLSDANDKIVFLRMADKGFSVVLIGIPTGDYRQLRQHPDIHFLGVVPYQQLPSYAAHFDVALLNWRMHEWILNCFPVKALEYLALGLPVVSCRIPVLMEHLRDEISFVRTADEFADEARRLVVADTPVQRRKRREAVRLWSWSSRFEYVREVLEIA